MNKAEKKFRLYAILVVFVLLTVLLSVINGVNFTMAAMDADEITQRLETRKGQFERKDLLPAANNQTGAESMEFEMGSMGPMGPESPEMNASLRYFTFAFSKNGEAVETVAFNISAVTEDEAREWASSLLKESTGWTRVTYRYRVYNKGNMTYVTVIDQGRELLSSFRILVISAVGEVISLVIAWFVLLVIGKKIYAPIRESDRKQKSFIKSVNHEFRLPLTIIDGNTEQLERKYGPDDQTRSTHRQVGKMNELVDKLGNLSEFDDEKSSLSEVPLSECLIAAIDKENNNFTSKGIDVELDVAPDIYLVSDIDSISRMVDELVSNVLKFAETKALFKLSNDSGNVLLEVSNDTSLSEGEVNQVFDRFTTLDNAKDRDDCPGLGLSYVKELVKKYNGRASAFVSKGMFIIRITM